MKWKALVKAMDHQCSTDYSLKTYEDTFSMFPNNASYFFQLEIYPVTCNYHVEIFTTIEGDRVASIISWTGVGICTGVVVV